MGPGKGHRGAHRSPATGEEDGPLGPPKFAARNWWTKSIGIPNLGGFQGDPQVTIGFNNYNIDGLSICLTLDEFGGTLILDYIITVFEEPPTDLFLLSQGF